MPAQVEGVVYKNTKKLTGIRFDDPAISAKVFFNRSWLQGHGIGTEEGDLIALGVSSAEDVADLITDEVEEIKTDTDDALLQETEEAEAPETADERFAEFFDKNVVVVSDGRLTSDRVWKRWAAENGMCPEESEIVSIAKSSMASRIRDLLSPAPPTRRGRVDGRVQYYWPGYGTGDGDEATG